MQLVDGRPVYSATDLVGFLTCGHLTDLERAALAGLTRRPQRDDPELDAIAERGKQHEQRYLETLQAAERTVVDLDDGEQPDDRGERYRSLAERTRQAIHDGADVIYQACFFDGTWLGFADFLLRVERPDAPLGWAYEVADTKLAHRVKASALVQICVYDEMLEAIQGVHPERMHAVLGGKERETATFRTADVSAYYRAIRARFLEIVGAPPPVAYPPPPPSYPEPVEHCDVCRWAVVCAPRRRADDHLSLVAGIAARTRAELAGRGIDTRRKLAALELPLDPKLQHTRLETLERVQQQAHIQVRGEDERRHLHQLLPPATIDGELDPTKGLLALPEPSPGDLFLDLEGDPFAGEDGIDYLFGVLEPGRTDTEGRPLFHAFWSRDAKGRVTPAAEQRAFERTIDFIMDRLAADPQLHIYHYAPYEPSHLGRLMGRYATRQNEVDELFREDRLIDLYGVVRHGLRASVESYSIKRLEPFYDFERAIELRDAGSSIVEFEHWLRMGGVAGVAEDALAEIEAYNRDDVLSTWKLRDWLETLRDELGQQLGTPLPRRRAETGQPDDELSEWLQQVDAVAKPLVEAIPDDEIDRAWTDEERARRLMANLVGWHRREQKPAWWRYFNQLNDMTDEDLMEAREPLGMLELVGPASDDGRWFRYRFPEQDFDLEGTSVTNVSDGSSIAVEDLDDEANEIVLRFRRGRPIVHPTSLVSFTYISTKAQEQNLLDIGRSILEHGIDGDGPHQAARQLLLRRPPRMAGHPFGAPLHTGDDTPGAARDLVTRLDRSVLAIQGPPGSGKTYTGARMIVDLVAQGKRVGVTANSHKVIGKLLDDVVGAAAEVGRTIRIGQKPGQGEAPTCTAADAMDNGQIAGALAAREVDVVGGTAWLWAKADLAESLDVLIIDEAGQFSLANSIAVSPSAESMVLLGDPQQLDQPVQGSHPIGAERSALAHLLGPDTAVMPAELGLFLERTWRLHPDICDYTSEVFYDSELLPQPGNEWQALRGVGTLDGEGIRFVAVDHADAHNDNRSPEEADVVGRIVCDLFDGRSQWVDRDGRRRPIDPRDILVITPYNAQRKLIAHELEQRGGPCADVAVGTVDKFQGQQAPISIYSMASSTPEDAPRGMDFLYSLNRLNVATSRARCLTLVVASPALARALARTPRQMQLANAFCRLVELDARRAAIEA